MKSENLTVRMPQEDKAAFLAVCKAEDVPAGQVIRRLVRDWVKQQQQNPAPQ